MRWDLKQKGHFRGTSECKWCQRHCLSSPDLAEHAVICRFVCFAHYLANAFIGWCLSKYTPKKAWFANLNTYFYLSLKESYCWNQCSIVSVDETMRILNASFYSQRFVLLNFWLSGGVVGSVSVSYSKSLMFHASNENSQTILQAAAHSQLATRDVSSGLKPMFQSGISSSTSWAFYLRVQGAESDSLVWSFSMPQSVAYLHMKGASAVVKSVIAD